MANVILYPIPDLDVLESACLEVGIFLEGIKSSVNAEIRTYPTPIPRCDAQFNHLYEQRSRACRQLALMGETHRGFTSLHDHTQFLAQFVDAPSYDDSQSEQNLKERLRVMLRALDKVGSGGAKIR